MPQAPSRFRTATAAWLQPMMDAADAAGMTPAETQKLMWQASMPAAESTNPHAEWRAKNAPEGAAIVAIDWVRFGYLLRHRLGWDDSYGLGFAAFGVGGLWAPTRWSSCVAFCVSTWTTAIRSSRRTAGSRHHRRLERPLAQSGHHAI